MLSSAAPRRPSRRTGRASFSSQERAILFSRKENLMRRRNLLTSFCVLLCLLTIIAAAQSAQQAPQRDMEKERAIWQRLQAVSPASVETFKQATAALDSENYAEAARLYEQVTKQAPEFTPALRRLGMSYMQTGK